MQENKPAQIYIAHPEEMNTGSPPVDIRLSSIGGIVVVLFSEKTDSIVTNPEDAAVLSAKLFEVALRAEQERDAQRNEQEGGDARSSTNSKTN